jgi:dTDP-4-dehydrorhamnose 3,5-epimerase
MEFVRTEIPEVVIIQPKVFGDERGYFTETFRKDLFDEFIGYDVKFCQDNESKSSYGVLRGLHYQLAPYSQSKLVRVIEGKVLDVAVDMRKESPTFGKHVAAELSAENKKQLFIPQGFAHGFVVLSETAIFAYKVDNYYAPEHDRGVRFDDPELRIDWQVDTEAIQLSEKDAKQPLFKDAEIF